MALSGAHTIGSCHRLRSGFDGPWTSNPLKFDNEYFRNLLNIEWKPREWDGPLQYADPSGELMMLPTDMALVQDEKFLEHVKAYAEDEALFFKDFAEAFGKLISLGCPEHCDAKNKAATKSTKKEMTPDSAFRDLAMHGSLERMKEMFNDDSLSLDVNSLERHSKRTALHKAAYFGHSHVVDFLCSIKVNVNAVDGDGDTALHDASRFGHVEVVQTLLNAEADRSIVNHDGKSPLDLAQANGKTLVVELLDKNIEL